VTAVAALAALAAGAVLGFLAGRRTTTRAPDAARAPDATRPLAEAAIEVRDRLTAASLTARLDAGLAAAGWRLIDPTGSRFDPAAHDAVDRDTTIDPTRNCECGTGGSGGLLPGFDAGAWA
jgi:hypothetical protein